MLKVLSLVFLLALAGCVPNDTVNPIDKILCDPTNGQAYIGSFQRYYQMKRMPSVDAVCQQYKTKE